MVGMLIAATMMARNVWLPMLAAPMFILAAVALLPFLPETLNYKKKGKASAADEIDPTPHVELHIGQASNASFWASIKGKAARMAQESRQVFGSILVLSLADLLLQQARNGGQRDPDSVRSEDVPLVVRAGK